MKNSLSEADTEDNFEIDYSTPLKRLIGHHIFSYDSFNNMSTSYLAVTSIIVIVLLTAFTVGNILVFISKFELSEPLGIGWEDFRGSMILSASLTFLSVLLWGILMHSAMAFMGGKGNLIRSIAIYSIAQIPVVIRDFILLIIAFTLPVISTSGDLDPGSYINLTETYFTSHNIASYILIPLSLLYSNLIAGVGISAEHKGPKFLGWVVGVMVSIFSILLRFLV